MASIESEDECIEKFPSTNLYSELKSILEKRNELLRVESNTYTSIDHNDVDLTELLKTIPLSKPDERLEHNRNVAKKLVENVTKLSSESKIDFTTENESRSSNEINQKMANIKKTSDDIFKKLKELQVNFNDCLSTKTNIISDTSKKNFLKMHTQIVKNTCGFEKGIESVYNFDKDTLKKHVKENLNIPTIDEFTNACNELEKEIINDVYEEGMKSSKNHEHLVYMKKFNISDELAFEKAEGMEKIDPYTKNPILKPVTNTVCKHIYDQQSVEIMFQNKLSISCPYIGCSNKHTTKNHLKYD